VLKHFSQVEIQVELEGVGLDLVRQPWPRVLILDGELVPITNMQAIGPDMNDGVSQAEVGSDLCELIVGHVGASSDEEAHYRP